MPNYIKSIMESVSPASLSSFECGCRKLGKRPHSHWTERVWIHGSAGQSLTPTMSKMQNHWPGGQGLAVESPALPGGGPLQWPCCVTNSPTRRSRTPVGSLSSQRLQVRNMEQDNSGHGLSLPHDVWETGRRRAPGQLDVESPGTPQRSGGAGAGGWGTGPDGSVGGASPGQALQEKEAGVQYGSCFFHFIEKYLTRVMVYI